MSSISREPITLVLADDHAVVRSAMARMLGGVDGFAVVGEAASGSAAIEQALAHRPDVLVLDLVMPGADITRVLAAIPPAWGTRVLILTGLGEPKRAAHAIRAGCRGYVLKGSQVEVLIDAVRKVAAGRVALDPDLGDSILAELAAHEERLSHREQQVLGLVGRGLDNDEISLELGISAETVRAHLGHIMSKLEVSSRLQVLVYALTEGFVSIEDLRQTVGARARATAP